MKMINVVNGPQNASAVILGCMRMPALSVPEAAEMIRAAAAEGVNFFDHATCYGNGEAETRFGDAFPLTGLKREDVYIQGKCGLHFDRKEFDWSRDDILSSVDAILGRLKTDYLDALLLHRPDLLFDPEEVAEAFEQLEKSGKVRYFGVSNVTPGQLELLKKYVRQPLVFNQLQFSLDQTQLIDGGLYLNNLTTDRSISRDNGVLDYFRRKFLNAHHTVFQHGRGTVLDAELTAVGIFGGGIVDQVICNFVDIELNLCHIFRFEIIFPAQGLDCEQRRMGVFAAGVGLK